MKVKATVGLELPAGSKKKFIQKSKKMWWGGGDLGGQEISLRENIILRHSVLVIVSFVLIFLFIS